MKIRILAVLFLGLTFGYTPDPKPNHSKQPTTQVISQAEAIAIVRRYLQSHDDDPERYEYRAGWAKGNWYISAWRIHYPEKKGADRFVDGGYTDFFLDRDGKIIQVSPGG